MFRCGVESCPGQSAHTNISMIQAPLEDSFVPCVHSHAEATEQMSFGGPRAKPGDSEACAQFHMEGLEGDVAIGFGKVKVNWKIDPSGIFADSFAS